MRKKQIIFTIVLIVLLIAVTILLVLTSGNPWKSDDEAPLESSDSSETPAASSDAASEQEASVEFIPTMEPESSAEETFSAVEHNPEQAPAGESEYDSGSTISYDEPVLGGTITVGVADGKINGERSGLVMQVRYSEASEGHPYGIRLFPDFGTIGYCQEGQAQSLRGTIPYTFMRNGAKCIAGESCVLLGRTFDQQVCMTYMAADQFGICWYYDPIAEIPAEVVIRMQLYDLTTSDLKGIYKITLSKESGAFQFSDLIRYEPTSDIEGGLELVRQTALDYINSNSIFSIGSQLDAEAVLLDDPEEPYWSELADPDGFIANKASFSVNGRLIAVHVNTHTTSIGPVTLYYGLANGTSDDPEEEVSPQVTYLGYDWIGQTSWQNLTDMNHIEANSVTMRQYAPLQ